jgi:hypothetical protein
VRTRPAPGLLSSVNDRSSCPDGSSFTASLPSVKSIWTLCAPASKAPRMSAAASRTHSGLPWQRRFGHSLVVNVGVLGKPANDGRREVWYAVLDLAGGSARAELVPLSYDWAAQAASMRRAGLPEAFAETIETGWWTTCVDIMPPRERAAAGSGCTPPRCRRHSGPPPEAGEPEAKTPETGKPEAPASTATATGRAAGAATRPGR